MDLRAIERDLKAASGRSRSVEDYVSPALVERLSATLESRVPVPRSGDPLPAGWHTIFCLQAPARDALGTDGLASGFDLIPPVPMLRRMFGGARMTFHGRLVVGAPMRCESELVDAKVRSTPSSHLAIAVLRHRYYGPDGLAVSEEQDIIHLEPIGTAAEKPPGEPERRPEPTWGRAVAPDPIMLFRFSALTFNSHRIHYDLPYATGTEKLPGLIVQGKLIALQLLETVRSARPDIRPSRFEYRSGRPLYAGDGCRMAAHLDATGTKASLWAEDGKGRTVQSATMGFDEPVKG